MTVHEDDADRAQERLEREDAQRAELRGQRQSAGLESADCCVACGARKERGLAGCGRGV